MRLAIEAQRAIISTVANGGHGGSRRLNTLLKLQTVLCTEYRYVHSSLTQIWLWCLTQYIPHRRNVYFAVINLIGAGVFSFMEDHHHQCDGILKAEAAKIDNMIERIKHAVLGFWLYPINPGRFSNQYRTGADRCTPTLPR